MTLTERCIEAICQKTNGVMSLRQVSAIPDGYMKNRSQIWRLSVVRAREMDRAGLIAFDHRPGVGIFGAGSTRTTSKVWSTGLGRAYVKLCQEACRQSNLSWPTEDYEYGAYVPWQMEWQERRYAFRRALIELTKIGEPA
jgi:hypothetical protein